MEIMTFNIFEGAEETLPAVVGIVNSKKPDFLAIQEANTFSKNNNELLKELATRFDLPYFDISLSREFDFHVASFSKVPFKIVRKLEGFRNAALLTTIDSEYGEIAICNTHLTPYTENERLMEVEKVIAALEQYPRRIIIGDLNSLSPQDQFDSDLVASFSTGQRKKFTNNDQLQFKVISRLLAEDYLDTAVLNGNNNQNTVPTHFNDQAYPHPPLRLDYIFISSSLHPHSIDLEVIKSTLSNDASDHYPVIAALR